MESLKVPDKQMLTCMYAIVDYSAKRLNMRPLYPVAYKDIAAVVETTCKERLAFDQQAAIEYGATLEVLNEKFTLLPCRFGTFLQDENAVLQVLQEHYFFYKKKLEELRGKQEFGLKILSEKSVQAHNANNKKQCKDGKEYLLQKFYEYRADEERKRVNQKTVDVIHEELQKLSSMSVKNAEISGHVVFSCNYLVEKKTESFFCSKVEALQGMYPELKFLLTGPWPPYNFVAEN